MQVSYPLVTEKTPWIAHSACLTSANAGKIGDARGHRPLGDQKSLPDEVMASLGGCTGAWSSCTSPGAAHLLARVRRRGTKPGAHPPPPRHERWELVLSGVEGGASAWMAATTARGNASALPNFLREQSAVMASSNISFELAV